jgi:hypothetical protein
LDKVILN